MSQPFYSLVYSHIVKEFGVKTLINNPKNRNLEEIEKKSFFVTPFYTIKREQKKKKIDYVYPIECGSVG